VGEGRRYLREAPGGTIDLSALLSPAWSADAGRRAAPATASRGIARQAASSLESRLVTALDGQDGGLTASGLRVTTAERSFGAALTGAIRRGELRAPVKLTLGGAAGQSFGAWAGEGVSLVLEGTANDYVGKGLSGGHLVVRPAPEMVAGAALASAGPASFALAGNTCLYGATAGRLHVVGRAGMRFAIRNSGAEAVVEGLGPHGCEYMTGGTVVVLGPVGQSFGAGMTGGRAFLWDPSGRHVAALHAPSVQAVRLAEAVAVRDDGKTLAADLRRLLGAHRDAGSALAARLLDGGDAVLGDIWLVEPVPAAPAVVAVPAEAATAVPTASPAPSKAADAQPNRNRAVA
jgi:glutamate synthase domain-containing protein 3